jgi:hypothetical protein
LAFEPVSTAQIQRAVPGRCRDAAMAKVPAGFEIAEREQVEVIRLAHAKIVCETSFGSNAIGAKA